MNTNLFCFVGGIVMTALWLFGIKRGVIMRMQFAPWRTASIGRLGRPIRYWFLTVVWGCLSLALLVLPVLSWLGLRG
jgi:hypothetical protein